MKPRIKKIGGYWCVCYSLSSEFPCDNGWYYDILENFTNRLNRKDTGYKDCHGCTIREGDKLQTPITKQTTDSRHLDILVIYDGNLKYFEIIRP